jgi:5-methylcytosine-specific restriction endonuclease McrA
VARKKVHPNTLKRVRLAVYSRDGFRCRDCGWAPPVPDGYDGRYALSGEEIQLRGRKAVRTGQPAIRILELDHVLAYSKGGAFVPENLQALCNFCNVRKGVR